MVHLRPTNVRFGRDREWSNVAPKAQTRRRENLWMEAVDLEFRTVRELSLMTGLSIRRIQVGIKRARQVPLDPVSLWEIMWHHTPNVFKTNGCEWHGGPDGVIPKDLPDGCLRCLKSGLDHMIAQGRPIPADRKVPETPKPKETRRQRRSRLSSQS